MTDINASHNILFMDILHIFYLPLHRGSYMSAHVLLNLLNELGKRDNDFVIMYAT